MRKPAHALLVASSVLLAAPITGCATGAPRSFAGKVDTGNIGLAMQAQAAIEKGDPATAVRLAERMVENRPTDAGFRTLLGNAYLAAGRFRSAEAAFADAIAMIPNQAGVPLKLVLAQAAQGRADEALATLEVHRDRIDAADAGLAMALAGRPGAAIELLDQVARAPEADARVRQNLALAHALAGDWVRARSVAAQDLAGDQLETRMSEWASLARPSAPGSQIAAMIGVSPSASDPGQPARLALRQDGTTIRLAAAKPATVVAAEPQLAAAEPMPAPVFEAPVAEPTPVLAAAEPAAQPLAETSPDIADMVDSIRREPVRTSGALPKVAELRRAAAKRFGQSRAVVQLGAYATPESLRAGWAKLSRRHGSIRGYVPASARFQSSSGPVYRLSLKGFANDGRARSLCMRLKASGGACFVRNAAGDAAVRFAAR